MTGTFQLTGRILDKNKQPVKRARLVLASNTPVLRDTVANEVYAPPPRVTTDDDGYLCVDLDGNRTPADTPGVDLVVGVQYGLRGVNRQLIGDLVFTAPAAGQTRDIADIINEPPVDDPTFADVIIELRARLDALEALGGGGGGGGVSDHGALTGLSDDDHPQYLNTARGDGRYYTQSQVDNQQATQDTAIAAETARATTAESALNAAKAPLASPTFTGTVGGISKAMVGLANADNTSDAAKPVSTAQAAAIAVAAATHKDALYPAGDTLPSVEAIEGGGVSIPGYTWPAWGYGGSTADANALSPTLLDLDDLGVDRMMWLPGFGVTTLDNRISTPYVSALSGNSAGVAQDLTWDFHFVSHDWDPIAGQSSMYLMAINNMFWWFVDETGFLHFRARYATASATDAVSTQTIPTRADLDLRVVFKPRGDDGTSPWTCEFLFKDAEGDYQTLGDLIPGDRSIAAYVPITGVPTPPATTPTPTQYVLIGQNHLLDTSGGATGNQALRGGLIHARMQHGATVVADLDFAAWTPNSSTYTDPQGHVWTLNNPQADNWVAESALAVAPGEYVTLTGAPAGTQLTTHGIYPELTLSGFEWRASSKVARDAYRTLNTVVNLAETPAKQEAAVTVTPDGALATDAAKFQTALGILATEALVASAAGGARSGAVSEAGVLVRAAIDEFTATLSGGTAYTGAPVAGAGEVFIYAGHEWESTGPVPAGLAPTAIGDGSSLSQEMLLAERSGFFLAADGTGGYGGTVRQVTTLADDTTGATVGSFRYHLNAHEAAWRADQTTRSIITFDQVSDAACLAALDVNGYVNINLAANVVIKSRNLTITGAGIKRGKLRFNPGGTPGPKAYGVTNALKASGSTTPTFTLSTIDVGGTRLAVGVHVDVVKKSGSVWTNYVSNAIVTAFDKDAKTITIDQTLAVDVPSGSSIVLAGNVPGTLGFQLLVGGSNYNDCFSPTNIVLDSEGRAVTPGNLILHEFAWTGNWGGDVLDTGNAKDVVFNNWADAVWVHRCEFANPDPFHDILFGINQGSRNFTVSWCHFHDHYKAINHFNGASGSSGTDGITGIQSPTHSFPPGYSTEDPGPYRYEIPTTKLHGNEFMVPVTIGTASWNHNWFQRLGQRAVKADNYSEVHNWNNLHTEGGMAAPGTVIVGGSVVQSGLPHATRFPPGEDEVVTTPVQTLVQTYAKYVGEWDIYIPHKNATGGALQAVKRSKTGDGHTGYTRLGPLWLETNTGASGPYTVAAGEGSYDPLGKVPDFGNFYSYTPDTDRDSVYEQITEGAGTGTQRTYWTLLGPASIPSTITIKENGANIGSGGSAAASDTINFVGASTSYDSVARQTTVTVAGSTDASTTVKGIVELATTTEATTGTDTVRAVTPAGLQAVRDLLQPVDTDLTAIAALSTTTFGRALLTTADAAAARTALALGTAATSASGDFQPVDSDLTAIAALTTTTFGRSLLTQSNGAAVKSLIGVVDSAPLARLRYQPSTSQPNAVTVASSTTFADLSAAAVTASWTSASASMFDLTFTVPTSQLVEVEWEFYAKSSATGATLRGGIVDPTGAVTFTGANLTSLSLVTGTTGQTRLRLHQTIDLASVGVAANASLTLRPQWLISSASATGTYNAGGTDGPILGFVRAL